MKTSKLPFFARYLEGQSKAVRVKSAVQAGGHKGKKDKGGSGDEPIFVTLKYPSDSEDTGSGGVTI
jgi:hypothetical protein